jgi:uncharacterized protein
MSYQALAFYIGLFASVHCVVMCGPLMITLQAEKPSVWEMLMQKLVYQTGRITTYGIQGFILGLAGSGFHILGLQNAIAILTGMILIVAGLTHFIKRRSHNTFGLLIFRKLNPVFTKLICKPYGSLFLGILNGILPCGITYLALAQAVNLGTPGSSAMFMLWFGIGTLPLLFATTLFPLVVRKFKIPAAIVPVLYIVCGGILLTRALNLEVPFIFHNTVQNSVDCK